VNAHSEVKRE